MHRPLHLVTVEVVGTAEDDGGSGALLRSTDKNQLVVANAALCNLSSVTYCVKN